VLDRYKHLTGKADLLCRRASECHAEDSSS
jgi:hypothetical protein